MKPNATKKKHPKKKSRRLSLRLGFAFLTLLALLCVAGEWFVHHPPCWLTEKTLSWPSFLTQPLLVCGSYCADVTDGLDLTGTDAVYEYDQAAPVGSITFAGLPRRIGSPAPTDIRIIDRGIFKIGWSDTLRHAVWCAYHVPRAARFPDGKRPNFLVEREIPLAPHPDAYTHSGYDRGHMVPNHAIISRFGEEARRKTFLMSNIAPQTPALNRGIWRDLEHRIADFWTARYGEIWVVVGTLPSASGKTFGGKSGIDIPESFYQVILAQEGLNVRALAVLIPQTVSWDDWAVHHRISIDELEQLTGLDFNPDLPTFIQDPLEAQLPTRLWPVRPLDIPRQILSRFN